MTRYWTSAKSVYSGDASVTFNDNNILTTSVIKPYASRTTTSPAKYSKVTVTSGTAVLYFDSGGADSSMSVKLLIINGT